MYQKNHIYLGQKSRQSCCYKQYVKQLKISGAVYEALDQAFLKWFLNSRSQNVPLSGAIIQEKASSYAEELNIENFKACSGCLRRWKE